MKIAFASLAAVLLAASPALAGDGSIVVTPGTGTTIVHTKTDAAGENFNFTAIGDGVAGANAMTVKAPNTAPVAGDSPAVVALHPSSFLPPFASPPTVNVANTNTNGQKTSANSAPVVLASDQSPVPAGVSTNNATVAPHICGSHAFAHVTASGATQVLALSASKNIYICDYSLSNQATATNAYLESATAASCGGTVAQIDQIWSMAVNGGVKGTKAFYTGLNTGASNALCVNSSAAATFDVAIEYDQY